MPKNNKVNTLILGSGGREHALGWKLKQSKRCGKLYFAPGNGGTGSLGTNVIGLPLCEVLVELRALGVVDPDYSAGVPA